MRRVPISNSFDLHSFRAADVPSVVDEYLREARAAGILEVRLIHGKGVGVRRAQVRRLLASRSDLRFIDAPPERGGHGATIVFLRPLP